MEIDKNQAIIDYLLQCPTLASNPMFFNCVKAESDNKQIITLENDKVMDKTYIDGSVEKRYTFTIIDFRAVTYNPIVNQLGYSNENVEQLLDVQGIIDWITEQNNLRNFPNFGDKCLISSISSTTNNPRLNTVDTTASPALAKYSTSIRVEYLDTSQCIWNN